MSIMVGKLCASTLLILIFLPFTAPFSSCDVTDLTRHAADRSSAAVDGHQALIDDGAAVSERSWLRSEGFLTRAEKPFAGAHYLDRPLLEWPSWVPLEPYPYRTTVLR